MKILSEILEDVPIIETHGNPDASVSMLSLSNKDIEKNSLFTAIIGNVIDGHLFIDDAIAKGAKAIIYQNDLENREEGITYIKVPDTKEALGMIAGNFYDNPSRKLKLIGITGTNGKTTIGTLLHQLFRNLGHKAGLIGTVVNKVNDDSSEAERTTPDQITLNRLLAEMVEAGCEYCFMEVSSHAMSEKRIAGITFAGGVFTNLTLDHLDYHKTFEEYRDAKKAFFDGLSPVAFAISNKDDANGEYMLRDTQAKKHFYALKSDAEFMEHLPTKLIGEFNAYNVLAVYATAIALEQDPKKIKEEIKNLEPVEGRFQYIKSASGITGIVDYAHTPDALQNVLKTINIMKAEVSARQGLAENIAIKIKVITVIGCGGDRDKSKRPLMAKIGYDLSDILILTSDNPRSESPNAILEDMKEGLPKTALVKGSALHKEVFIIPDRHEAIAKACSLALAGLPGTETGDYILLAGKGHEKYQETNGVKTHFDDMEELKKYLIQ